MHSWRALLIVGFTGTMTTVAQESPHVDRADQLRAGYLLNFVKFVEWPGGAVDHPTLCFSGGEGIRDAIVTAQAARHPGANTVVVRMLGKSDGVGGCQLLYVSTDSELDIPARPALLTVGEARDFTSRGGVIGLFPEGNRLRFNINLGNARRAGLRVSSSLLQLASHVEEGGR